MTRRCKLYWVMLYGSSQRGTSMATPGSTVLCVLFSPFGSFLYVFCVNSDAVRPVDQSPTGKRRRELSTKRSPRLARLFFVRHWDITLEVTIGSGTLYFTSIRKAKGEAFTPRTSCTVILDHVYENCRSAVRFRVLCDDGRVINIVPQSHTASGSRS